MAEMKHEVKRGMLRSDSYVRVTCKVLRLAEVNLDVRKSLCQASLCPRYYSACRFGTVIRLRNNVV